MVLLWKKTALVSAKNLNIGGDNSAISGVDMSFMKELERDIHAEARESTARQAFKAMTKTDRPDVAVAILLRVIDEWFEKGVTVGKRS